MKKRIFITIVSMLIFVFIVGAIYVGNKLPDSLSISEFAKGLVGVELKKELLVEVDDNIFFYKDGTIEKVQESLEKQSIKFIEQQGTTFVCEINGQRLLAEWQSVTHWHCILVLQDVTIE